MSNLIETEYKQLEDIKHIRENSKKPLELISTGEKKIYLEAIRVIACFLVIVNHTNSSIFLEGKPSLTWFASLSYFFISKPAVPLFLMVSGVTLLGKDESFGKVWKRILRMIIVLITFSFVYFVDNIGLSKLSFMSIGTFLSSIMSINITNAFWYLYIYIGLLMVIPIVRKLITVLDKKNIIYFLCISLVVTGTFPIITHYFPQISLSTYILNPLFSVYIGIMVLGYVADKWCLENKRITIYLVILYLVLLLSQITGTYFEYLNDPKKYLFFDKSTLITITASAVCVFCIIKFVFQKFNLSYLHRTMSIVGQCTFGIYLFSDLFIKRLSPIRSILESELHPMQSVILFQLVVFSAGFLCTYLLRKIPMLKRYI